MEGLAAALWEEKGYTAVYRVPDSGDDGVDDWRLAVLKACLYSVKGLVSYCL
ncbi:MAG: hypothetical protein PHI13_02920 [Methylococcales bacterium]|nr:hypothetical protein [Methylococcales bacterium]